MVQVVVVDQCLLEIDGNIASRMMVSSATIEVRSGNGG